MKVTSPFFNHLHLDPNYGLLTARSLLLCLEYFKLLDFRGSGSLDDIQFESFMAMCTDLNKQQIYNIFDVFDLDCSGSMEFDEFFALVSILVAIKDGQAKQFMYRHWRTCFEILDEDGSKSVSRNEFETLGFLFNFSKLAVRNIFEEFDIFGNNDMSYNEFRFFVFAAMDIQAKLEKKKQAEGGFFKLLLKWLSSD